MSTTATQVLERPGGAPGAAVGLLAQALVGALRRSEVLEAALAALEGACPHAAWCVAARLEADRWDAVVGRGVADGDLCLLVEEALGHGSRLGVATPLPAGRSRRGPTWGLSPHGEPDVLVGAWPASTFRRQPRATLLEAAARTVGTALRAAEVVELLVRQSAHDPLTGLLNRRALFDTLEREVARATRLGGPVSALFCDLDGFKAINDRLGHAAGDGLLAALGQLLTQAVRASDSVGRVGGDEFVIVLPDTDLRTAYTVGRRLSRRLAMGEGALALSVSYGAACTSEGLAPLDLVDRADRRMLSRKRSLRRMSARARSLGA